MKKVIFTESQLSNILGEDFSSYLPNIYNEKDVPANSYGTEITTSDKLEDGEEGEQPTTDKIAKQKGNLGPYGYFGRAYGRIFEDNQDLVGNDFKINQNLKRDIVNNGGDEKFLEPSGYKATYKRIYDLKKKWNETPEEFTDIDKRVLNDYEKQLSAKKGNSKRQKENKARMGIENAYQKPGGTKNANNGMAHTKKVQNGTITYY